MSIRAVDVAIHRLRALRAEMEDVDSEDWLPEQTLHVFVDPVLRALGWDPSDPDECRPCYGSRLAGYLLSADPVADEAAGLDLVIFAMPIGASLLGSVSCMNSSSKTASAGVAVLTNGTDWQIYDRGRLLVEVDVVRMRRDAAAGVLTEWLGWANFR